MCPRCALASTDLNERDLLKKEKNGPCRYLWRLHTVQGKTKAGGCLQFWHSAPRITMSSSAWNRSLEVPAASVLPGHFAVLRLRGRDCD
jgi:hypothetical protein